MLKSTFILLFSLPSLICLICQGTCPCTNITQPITTPSLTGYWVISDQSPDVTLYIISPSCIYQYFVTGIDIVLYDMDVNISDYLITYKLNDIRNSALLSALNISSTGTNAAIQVQINQLTVEELTISRFSIGEIGVRYTVRGYSRPRVTVLSYAIRQPNTSVSGVINIDDAYTGVCNGEFCFGGRGQLMDGVLGNDSVSVDDEINTGWNCSTNEGNCTFPLNILLTRQVTVSHLILHGVTRQGEIPPSILFIQPNISTNSTVNETGNSYSIIISPINSITDKIFINMEIPYPYSIVLNEVEIFSYDVNIGVFKIDQSNSVPITTNSVPTTNSTVLTTNSTVLTLLLNVLLNPFNEILFIIVFPVIIVVILLVQVILFLCCVYQCFEKRKYKRVGRSDEKGLEKKNHRIIYVNPREEMQLPTVSQEVHPNSLFKREPVIPPEIQPGDPEYVYNNLTEYTAVEDSNNKNPFIESINGYDYGSVECRVMPAEYEAVGTQ